MRQTQAMANRQLRRALEFVEGLHGPLVVETVGGSTACPDDGVNTVAVRQARWSSAPQAVVLVLDGTADDEADEGLGPESEWSLLIRAASDGLEVAERPKPVKSGWRTLAPSGPESVEAGRC